MKDEKWKSASPRQMKRITQLVKLCGVGVNFQGSRGLSPGTSLCHKTVAKSLVRLGLCEYRSAWHGQIVDLKA